MMITSRLSPARSTVCTMSSSTQTVLIALMRTARTYLLYLREHLACGGVRVFEDLRHLVDRAGRDEARKRIDDLVSCALRRPLADDRADLRRVLLPALVLRISFVPSELRPANDLAQQAPMFVGRRGDGYLAVFGVEDIEGAEEGVSVADRARVLAAVRIQVDVVLAEAEDGVVHRNIQELALAGLPRVKDGREDANGGKRSGHDVADARAAGQAAGLWRPGDV